MLPLWRCLHLFMALFLFRKYFESSRKRKKIKNNWTSERRGCGSETGWIWWKERQTGADTKPGIMGELITISKWPSYFLDLQAQRNTEVIRERATSERPGFCINILGTSNEEKSQLTLLCLGKLSVQSTADLWAVMWLHYRGLIVENVNKSQGKVPCCHQVGWLAAEEPKCPHICSVCSECRSRMASGIIKRSTVGLFVKISTASLPLFL